MYFLERFRRLSSSCDSTFTLPSTAKLSSDAYFLLLLLLLRDSFCCIIFLRERERTQEGEGQIEGDTESEVGSEMLVHNPMWGLNPQSLRS